MNEHLKTNLVTGLQNEAIIEDEYGTKISRCVKCGCIIGDENSMDWYSLIRRKYCDSCQVIVRAEQHTQAVRNARKSKKELNTKVKALENENAKIRKMVSEKDCEILKLKAENLDLLTQITSLKKDILDLQIQAKKTVKSFFGRK